MITNYIKTALRNLKRNKLFTFLNLISLIIGICSFLTIILWVNFELSYDKYHSNYDKIYRLNNKWPDSDLGLNCPGAAAAALKEDFPEIIKSTRYIINEECKIKYKEAFYSSSCYVDRDFFEIFDIDVVEGSESIFFENPNSIILTESIARKLFVNESSLGKIVNVDDGKYLLEVTGVISDIPENSHLKFEMLLPTSIGSESMNNWTNNWPHIYVMLNSEDENITVNEKLKNYIQKYLPDASNSFSLEPLNRIHLYSSGGEGVGKYISTFLIIGFIILLMSCLNYIILSTSLYFKRLKNIGIRKILGASKRKIIVHLLTETFILTIIAVVVAFIIIELIRPGLISLLGKEIIIHYSFKLIGLIILIILATNVLAGLYPSVYSSTINPLLIITDKGKLTSNSAKKSSSLISISTILLVIQFSTSLFLISTVLGINSQLNYLFNKDIGYSKENIITIPFSSSLTSESELLKQELLNYPNIENIALSYPHPVIQDGETAIVTWENKLDDKNVYTKFKFIDEDYLNTFDIELIEGRFYNKDIKSDYLVSKENETGYLGSYVINETLANDLGFENSIGQSMALILGGREYYGKIIGIVKDFNDESLHEKAKPITMVYYRNYDHLNIKFKSEIDNNVIQQIEIIIKKHFPDYVSNYEYLDSQIESLYKNDNKSKLLYRYAAILAILIALLGLIGSSSFSIELKTKEIAIRKVNGATFKDIILLVLRKYILIQLVAVAISIPVSYYFISKWLQNFAYQQDFNIWIFVLSGVSSLIIVVGTIMLIAYKVVRRNPVESLRYE